MGLSFKKIKRWFLMMTGKSIYHVNQNMGKFFVPGELKGYFNNLTEKVIKDNQAILEPGNLPIFITEKGEEIVFPVAAFQYALGCYDLFLETKEKKYFDKFIEISKWALSKQEKCGRWNNFWYIYPDHPFGAMCQGEASSLLARAYIETGDANYLYAAEAGIDYMLNNNDGIVISLENNEDLILLEYEDKPAVLNGWIFALFGLYDVGLVSKKREYFDAFEKSLKTIKNYLPSFDNGYWSMYDLDKRIASPFYHSLHIAQLNALYLVSGDDVFHSFQKKFEKYKKNPFKKMKAFIVKSFQKIKE